MDFSLTSYIFTSRKILMKLSELHSHIVSYSCYQFGTNNTQNVANLRDNRQKVR